MINTELNWVFDLILDEKTNETESFFTRQSNKNTFYYKAKVSKGGKIMHLKRIKAPEFWEKMNKAKIQAEEEENYKREVESVKDQSHTFEQEEPQQEVELENQEEEEEDY